MKSKPKTLLPTATQEANRFRRSATYAGLRVSDNNVNIKPFLPPNRLTALPFDPGNYCAICSPVYSGISVTNLFTFAGMNFGSTISSVPTALIVGCRDKASTANVFATTAINARNFEQNTGINGSDSVTNLYMPVIADIVHFRVNNYRSFCSPAYTGISVSNSTNLNFFILNSSISVTNSVSPGTIDSTDFDPDNNTDFCSTISVCNLFKISF